MSGGYEYEAMEDLTGGVVVSFNLKTLLPVPDLFRIMEWCLTRQSIITAEIEKVKLLTISEFRLFIQVAYA